MPLPAAAAEANSTRGLRPCIIGDGQVSETAIEMERMKIVWVRATYFAYSLARCSVLVVVLIVAVAIFAFDVGAL